MRAVEKIHVIYLALFILHYPIIFIIVIFIIMIIITIHQYFQVQLELLLFLKLFINADAITFLLDLNVAIRRNTIVCLAPCVCCVTKPIATTCFIVDDTKYRTAKNTFTINIEGAECWLDRYAIIYCNIYHHHIQYATHLSTIPYHIYIYHNIYYTVLCFHIIPLNTTIKQTI